MRIHFVMCILATLAMIANSSRFLGEISSQPPSTDCSTIIYDMVDCVSYLSDGSTESKPDSSCCAGYESVVATDPECICEALKSSAQMGIDLNMTRAMGLPAACGLPAPPIGDCGTSIPPATAPAPVPVANPPHHPHPPHPAPVPAPPTVSPVNPPPITPAPPTMSPVYPPPVTPAPSTPSAGGEGGGGIAEVPAAAPLKGGAYSISTSFLVPITLLVASCFFILV